MLVKLNLQLFAAPIKPGSGDTETTTPSNKTIYEQLKYNGNKIQVDSAIRDGNGKDISNTYQTKITSTNKIPYSNISETPTIPSGDLLVSATDRATWNGKQNAITSTNKLSYSLISGTPTIPTVPDNIVVGSTQSYTIALVDSLPANPDANTIYLIKE